MNVPRAPTPAPSILVTDTGLALESDEARVARCRMQAEEYRTIAEAVRNQRTRATLLSLAEVTERLAREAQARIDRRTKAHPKRKT